MVAGPGTGKTTVFKELLKGSVKANGGGPDDHLVLTFINNLRNDLVAALSDTASVYTLHSHCLRLLYQDGRLRSGLTSDFVCLPGLAHLIKIDWDHIRAEQAPQFVAQMRNLESRDTAFYFARGNYYDAVDFDDCVYRVYERVEAGIDALGAYKLVLIDEYQDFNALENALIEQLAQKSPILIAGDDDQALYSVLRGASCEHIRSLYNRDDYEKFELPFCMRCPKVIVDAVNDVLVKAKGGGSLEGRIQKPYKHYPPAKGVDSARYPTIALVKTSVQSAKVNYMGRYIAQIISEIPPEEIAAANADNYPVVLVIVAKPYRGQIVSYLEEHGFVVDTKREEEHGLTRDHGLAILKDDPESNVGWRIVLETESASLMSGMIAASADMTHTLSELLPKLDRDRIVAEAQAFELPTDDEPSEDAVRDAESRMVIRVTSFEGAKGLSAQHVVIAGLHDGELPRKPKNIEDIEICKFVVGLTRSRKRCYLLYTGRFAGEVKQPSTFLHWIGHERYERIFVNKKYWQAQEAGAN